MQFSEISNILKENVLVISLTTISSTKKLYFCMKRQENGTFIAVTLQINELLRFPAKHLRGCKKSDLFKMKIILKF